MSTDLERKPRDLLAGRIYFQVHGGQEYDFSDELGDVNVAYLIRYQFVAGLF